MVSGFIADLSSEFSTALQGDTDPYVTIPAVAEVADCTEGGKGHELMSSAPAPAKRP